MSGRLKALFPFTVEAERREVKAGGGNLQFVFVGVGVKNKECAGKSALLDRFFSGRSGHW